MIMRSIRARRIMLAVASASFGFACTGSPVLAAGGTGATSITTSIELGQIDTPQVTLLSEVHSQSTGSASCYNNPSPANCNGTDPQKVGCSADAYTVYGVLTPIYDNRFGNQFGYLELRYSPHCGTNWARSTITDSNYIQPDLERDTEVDGSAGREDDTFNDQSVRYSAQVYAPTTQMCADFLMSTPEEVIASTHGSCG